MSTTAQKFSKACVWCAIAAVAAFAIVTAGTLITITTT